MLITVTLEPGNRLRGGCHRARLPAAQASRPRADVLGAPVGEVHVFAPEASRERCTFAMLLEVDPVGLVRNKRFRGDAGALGHYVNDRPYVASSMLAVAIGAVFRTAMTGRSDSYPELAASPLPLRIEIPVVSVRGDDDMVERLFSPCGWEVAQERIPLDPAFPEWGDSRFRAVTLTGRVRLAEALRQLYVLPPGARRREALLGRRRRGGQARTRGRGVARGSPRARPHHATLPAAPPVARGADRRRPDRGGEQAVERIAGGCRPGGPVGRARPQRHRHGVRSAPC